MGTVMEMAPSGPDMDRNKPTLRSFDNRSPIQSRPFSHLLYLGTTRLSDPEITTIAELVIEYLKEEDIQELPTLDSYCYKHHLSRCQATSAGRSNPICYMLFI